MPDETTAIAEQVDAGAQVFTKSTDGFLVGGFPELGDKVFNDGGTEIGTVSFFYDRVDARKFHVQVEGHAEDPLLVTVSDTVIDHQLRGQRLVALPGAAVVSPAGTMGASVAITNNT